VSSSSPTQLSEKDSEYLYLLTSKLLGVLSAIVFISLLAGVGLIVAYVLSLLFPPQGARVDATNQIQSLIKILWDSVIPLGQTVLKIAAPILILLVALAAIRRLSATNASPLDMRVIASDLPSVLAILIVVAICLLPFSGVEIPQVLNNVALVVVGFYFGRRPTKPPLA
jgi:hypothetical protein